MQNVPLRQPYYKEPIDAKGEGLAQSVQHQALRNECMREQNAGNSITVSEAWRTTSLSLFFLTTYVDADGSLEASAFSPNFVHLLNK